MPSIRIPSAEDDEQPATRKMLRLVRDELKSEIRSVGLKIESRFLQQDSTFEKIDAQFARVDARFAEMESRSDKMDSHFGLIAAQFTSIDGRFSRLESQMSELIAMTRYTNLMLEEDRRNSKSVYEGHQLLWQRLDRLENKS